VEKGWKGLLPLQSTKADVEKAFGNPEKVDENGYYNYRLVDAFVQVNNSTEPCTANQYDRGKFNVPKDSVLDMWIYIKRNVLVSDLKFDRQQYQRDTSGDVENVVYYHSLESGISIGASVQDAKQNEYVGLITYRPARKLRIQFECKN
jgi:hypothetical protein